MKGEAMNKVYCIVQYQGLKPVGEGTVVDVCLYEEDAKDMCDTFNTCKEGDECFVVEAFTLTR